MGLFGSKWAKIDRSSDVPDRSLTIDGDPVLKAVDKKYKKAQRAMHGSRLDPQGAIASINDALKLVKQEDSSLSYGQYLMLLEFRGRCTMILGDGQDALEQYRKIRILLQRSAGWESTLEGLTITGEIENPGVELVHNHYWTGRAQFLLKDPGAAVEELALGISEAMSGGDSILAQQGMAIILNECMELEPAESSKYLNQAALRVEELLQDLEIPHPVQHGILQWKAMARLRGGDYAEALSYTEQIIELIKKYNAPMLEETLRFREIILAKLEEAEKGA